jgi:hypothetical protein
MGSKARGTRQFTIETTAPISKGYAGSKTVDPEQTALTMIATIEGAVILSGLSGRKRDLALVMDALNTQIKNLC